MKQETLEEYFLGKMKEVLLFGNDAQAIRFMEKYFEAKQERSYSEEEVLEIIRQYALEEHLITSSKPDIWFEQFKKK